MVDALKDFAKKPPQKPVRTLSDAMLDFEWRFPASRLDEVAAWTVKAPNLSQAIKRAVASRNERGVMWNHQSKIRSDRYRPFEEALLRAMPRFRKCQTFTDVFGVVEDVRVWGWGPVGVYDVAMRIAAYLGHEPDVVYLHAGVRIGARALGLPYTQDFLLKKDLPKPLRRWPANTVEDFLCGYRNVFPTLEDDRR